MLPEQKFRELEERAERLLRSPFDAERYARRVVSPVVVIWRFPAFEPYESWCLASLRDQPQWFLRHSTWQRSADYARAVDPLKQAAFMLDPAPTPTHTVLDVDVGLSYAEEVVAKLRALEAPSEPGTQIGIDGVVNGLALPGRSLEREWWCDGPSEWRTFVDAIDSIWESFVAVFSR